jgi:hypothetical protein
VRPERLRGQIRVAQLQHTRGQPGWSRGRKLEHEITAEIRSTFSEAGFAETAFHSPDGHRFQIGAHRYGGPAVALTGEHLFTFVR